MGITFDKLWSCGIIYRINLQQSSNSIFELTGWTNPAPEKNKAVSEDPGRLKRLFLLRVRLKVLLSDSKDLVNHCQVLFSFFFDILLGVTLLKVNELIRCCYGITFCELEVELAVVNKFLHSKSSRLNVRFAQGPADPIDHHLACETNQTRQRNSPKPLEIYPLAEKSGFQEPNLAC